MTSNTRVRRAEGGLTRKGAHTRQRIVAAAADIAAVVDQIVHADAR